MYYDWLGLSMKCAGHMSYPHPTLTHIPSHNCITYKAILPTILIPIVYIMLHKYGLMMSILSCVSQVRTWNTAPNLYQLHKMRLLIRCNQIHTYSFLNNFLNTALNLFLSKYHLPQITTRSTHHVSSWNTAPNLYKILSLWPIHNQIHSFLIFSTFQNQLYKSSILVLW